MRPHDIVCRCCQERYNSTEFGCDICLPAKTNIIWPEHDLPMLESVLAQSLRTVTELADDLEADIKDARKTRGRKCFPDHVKAAKMLADANTSLVGEARKLRKEEAQTVKNLSWDEKAELMVGTVEAMPDEKRRVFLERMVARLRAVEGKLVSEGHLLTEPAEIL